MKFSRHMNEIEGPRLCESNKNRQNILTFFEPSLSELKHAISKTASHQQNVLPQSDKKYGQNHNKNVQKFTHNSAKMHIMIIFRPYSMNRNMAAPKLFRCFQGVAAFITA